MSSLPAVSWSHTDSSRWLVWSSNMCRSNCSSQRGVSVFGLYWKHRHKNPPWECGNPKQHLFSGTKVHSEREYSGQWKSCFHLSGALWHWWQGNRARAIWTVQSLIIIGVLQANAFTVGLQNRIPGWVTLGGCLVFFFKCLSPSQVRKGAQALSHFSEFQMPRWYNGKETVPGSFMHWPP